MNLLEEAADTPKLKPPVKEGVTAVEPKPVPLALAELKGEAADEEPNPGQNG